MSWAIHTPAPAAIPERPTLTSQQSSSLPSTPYQQPRHVPTRSRSRSPPQNSSPRSAHSELNHVLPPIRKHHGCKYETAMAHFRRRMPYSLGGELLPDDPGPLKESLDPKDDEKLTHDMTELYQSLLPSEESERRRARFVTKLENLLNERWPGNDIKVHVFGSSGNKLCSGDSDVDICITTTFKQLERVCTLAEFLAKSGMERVVCVSDAKVPIVKIWDPELQVACDMNVNNTTALENTRMIKTYVEIDKRARQLAMIVKHWTKRRILNDAALGGTLSSYTWICLIINFLQTRSPPILPSLQQRALEKSNASSDAPLFDDDLDSLAGFGDKNDSSLGTLLFQFFRYYGHEVDYEKSVMSVREGCLISKDEKRWHLLQNNRLCVEEPFTTSRNLGNTADDTSFRGLHMELRRAFSSISEGKLGECCEQYVYPPEEERTWERPAPQRRPIIASVPPLSSRGGRGGGRGGRRPSHFSRGPESNRRTSTSGNRQGHSKQSNPGFTAEIARQAQQAQTLLHDHLFQQIQMLQAQEQELRLQLQNQTYLNGRSMNSRLMRPYMNTSYPQQDSASNGASDETARTRAGTVNHPPLSAPIRPVFYNPSYFPMPISAVQGNHTNPPSPSMPPDTPETRRSHRRSSAASGSPRNNLRAQSQPARPQSSSVSSQTFGRTPFNVPGQPDGSQVPGLQHEQTQTSPPEVPGVDGDPYSLPNGVPVFPKYSYTHENLHPEYIGYYVGDAPQLQAGYYNSMASSLAASSPFSTSANGIPGYFYRSPDSQQAEFASKQQSNSISESSDAQSSDQQPLTRSKTVPDCGLLIVDGSHSTRGDRRPSMNSEHDNPYLSQSAPDPNDGGYRTPVDTSSNSPHHSHEPLGYGNVSSSLYPTDRDQLYVPGHVNGLEAHPQTNSVGVNGHLGRVETLSERLQRFQMADPKINGDGHGRSNTHSHGIGKAHHPRAADDEDFRSEKPVLNNKPARSATTIGVSRDGSAVSSPTTANRRVNGIADTENANNGVATQKAQLKSRQGQANSPNKVPEVKEKPAEPSSRKPNGIYNPSSQSSSRQSSGTSSGWQTTIRKKNRKGAKSQGPTNGPEPLPADESLRKGG